MPKTDPELIADWLERSDERAFHDLVGRYAGLVHATARRACADETQVADVSQLVFITLARKARTLAGCGSLGGWLHRTTLLHARNSGRKRHRESRKLERFEIHMESAAKPSPGDVWQDMQPVLDVALAALSAKDREAILLRFYRSLSVREIGETLGTSTAAAQKRIDRATGRLREKLARRGCLTGGALAAAMTAGFAADSQAAAPAVSLLASRAIAAAGVGAASTNGLIPAILMKSTTPISAAAVLLAIVWLIIESRSTAGLRAENATLERRFAESGAVFANTSSDTDSAGRLRWKWLGARLVATGRSDPLAQQQLWNRLYLRVSLMDAAQVAAALDEIAALEMPSADRAALQRILLNQLVRFDPKLALTRYFDDVASPEAIPGSPFSTALKNWAKTEPEAAAEWWDRQVAAGTGVAGADESGIVVELEAGIMNSLLSHNPAAAEKRLADLPMKSRETVLQRALRPFSGVEPQMFARLVRTYLPASQQVGLLADPVWEISERGGYPAVTSYLESIGASPGERAECVRKTAKSTFGRLVHQRQLIREDFDALRKWVDSQTPELTDSLTGEMLASMSTRVAGTLPGKLSFDHAAALALDFNRVGQRDDVLAGFLPRSGFANRAAARALAESIADPDKRAEVLEDLK